MTDTTFLLKTVAPRPSRNVLASQRLERRWAEVDDRLAIVVTAPQGFGKTTLLAQWRRFWLERGAFVAWATLDAQDDRARFVDLLFHSLRAATGRDAFAARPGEPRLQRNRELDLMTALLGEIARLAAPVVLVLDDVHRMPQDAMQELLTYLLNNAPSNLQVLLGTRRPLALELTDLMATGRLAELDAADLRLRLDETLAVLRGRFGSRITVDDAARVQGITEGWPLGLQLAISSIERATDLHDVIGRLSGRRGDMHRYFLQSMLSRLPPDEARFLVLSSILEVLGADVCAAVTDMPGSAQYLEKLARDSPIVTQGEGRDWLRLHSMARDFLLGQFDLLPADERRRCYGRAADWFAAQGALQDAARHALAAGDDERAGAYAAQCLLDIAREGRLAEARDWVLRLSPQAIARDVHLQISIAWVKALSEDADKAPGLIEQARAHPQFDASCEFPAAVVESAAAAFRDEPDRIEESLRPWAQAPVDASPLLAGSFANCRALVAMLAGDAEKARQVQAATFDSLQRDAGMRMVFGFTDMLRALSFVWEGLPAQAIAELQPRLDVAEAELGRRSTVAAMQSAVVAAAMLLSGEPNAAEAMLADRLDVIERMAMPDPIILAYRTMGEAALRRGDSARALGLFAGLVEFGTAHDIPRAKLTGLTLQIRVHACLGHAQTAAQLQQELEAMRPKLAARRYRVMAWYCESMLSIAKAYVCLAMQDPAGADAALLGWTSLPARTRQGVAALTIEALRVVAAHQAKRADAPARLRELLSLADLAGTRSFVLGLHPALQEILDAGLQLPHTTKAAVLDAAPGSGAGPASGSAPVTTGGLLTPKEARILALLAAGKSNKEIARGLDVGDETVKWHLKNIYMKLDAASRKHAVDRARLLGLIRA